MKIILMRHAKSSWNDPLQDDFDRALNGRGRSSATALGNWLRDKHYIPDQALVSSSARTKETFKRLVLECEVNFLETLYHARPAQMMAELKTVNSQTILMIAHNPGIAWFAQELLAAPPPHPSFFDYPTGATLVAEFPLKNWRELQPGQGRALDFIVPRELTG